MHSVGWTARLLLLYGSILLYPTSYYFSIFQGRLCYTFYEVLRMRPLKEKISITIDSDLLAQVKQAAEADDRSVSQYINLVLKQHLMPKAQTDAEK